MLIRLVFTEIQQFKNATINKEMYGHPVALSDSVRVAIHFVVNFDILTIGSIETWGFCKAWSELYAYVDQ